MDLYIPTTPDAVGPHFGALLKSDPARRGTYRGIVSRLEPDGRLGDKARYYIAGHLLRHSTLRGILNATGQRTPDWALDNRKADAQNEAFLADYRLRFPTQRPGKPVAA